MRTGYRWVFLPAGVAFLLAAIVVDYAFISETATGTLTHGEKLSHESKDILLAIGVAVLTVSLVDFLWSKAGGDPLSTEIRKLSQINDLISDSYRTGILRVHAKVQTSPNKNWKALIDASQNEIDLTGYQLLDIVDSDAVMDSLALKATNGVAVRVLLLPVTSVALRYAVSPENLAAMEANMKHAVQKFQKLRNGLPMEHRFSIATVDDASVLDASVRRFDGHMHVVHYLQSINTSDTPAFELFDNGSADSLFRTYKTWFDRMFTNATPV
jgi:hypothetical protein